MAAGAVAVSSPLVSGAWPDSRSRRPSASSSCRTESYRARNCSTSSTARVRSARHRCASGRRVCRERARSFARQGREVGYTLAWPPGRHPGDPLPLVVMLHGFGANHTNALTAMSPAQAVALEVTGVPLPPMAMVTVDGGGGYWNPHPGDDPMQMVIGELIPLCQRLNLGLPPHGIGTMGISMGGYGAVLFAEKHPEVVDAVAAISPAIWTTYEQARGQPRGVRVGGKLRVRRRGHPRGGVGAHAGPRGVGYRRPIPSRGRGPGAGPAALGRGRLLAGVSHRLVLHRPRTAVADVSRRPPLGVHGELTFRPSPDRSGGA